MGNALNLQEIDQEQALNLAKFYIQSNNNCFFFGRKGVGKMLDLETAIPTPHGFVVLKYLKEGDQLFDEMGNVCNVIKLHPIDYLPKSYKITFDDKTTVNACADHLWLTWDASARRGHTKPQIRKTKEILETLKTKTKPNGTNHSIPTALPINFPKQILPLDPYVLGCWLGDGRSTTGSIECADVEILEKIKKLGFSINQTKKSHNNKSKSNNFRIGNLIDNGNYGRGIGSLTKLLKELNLLNNKHIPDIYLRSSYEQRLTLLQGLMDTDGCCDKRGRMEYCSTIPQLAGQVLTLVASLGIKATLHKNKSYLHGKECKDRYRISFITKLNVFCLLRKLSNIKKSYAQDRRNTHRYIIDIKPISPIPMRCITVNSSSGLFLITKSFISTHNTDIAIQAAKECGYKVNYINLSVIERSDLLGYPNMTSEGDVITYKSPEFLPRLANNIQPDSVLLFDEVDKCYPEIWAPLLEILQFRTINGKPINAVSCLLTGNLINEGAFSNQISTAILDRGAKYMLSFNFEKWTEWARTHQVHDLIIGFLIRHPELACGKIEDTCYASPSPRGWTLASEAIIRARHLKISDIETITQIIAGFIGHEAAIKFKIWYECYKRFDPYIVSLIENGKMILGYPTLEATEKIVFVISACQHSKMKTLESKIRTKFPYLENLCRFFREHEIDPEIKMLALNNAFTFEMIAANKLYACKSFFEMFSEMNESFGIK